MQHKKKVQKFSIANKVDSNFMNSFLYHSISNLFYSKPLNLGIINRRTIFTTAIIFFLAFANSALAQDLPKPPTITSITIEPIPDHPGAVRLWWNPSPTDSIDNYIIYWLQKDNGGGMGFIPIDTIPSNEDTYLDIDAQAHIKSESYYMAAKKGYIGEPCLPHSTIYLNPIVFDSCKIANILTWTPYKGWDGGAYYNIYRNDDTEPIKGGISETTFTDSDINGNITYHYYIKAKKNGASSFSSTSNTVSVFTTPIKKPDSSLFYINNIIYDGNSANFTVNIDNSADLLGHALMVSGNNSTFTPVEFINFDKSSQTVEFTHDTTPQPFYYKVKAINVCNQTVLKTAVAQPIVLTVTSNETEATLNWNKSFIESSEDYSISITVDGEPSLLPFSPSDTTTTIQFEDIDPQNTAEVFCFKIEATEISNNNKSYSNEVCVSRIPKIEPPTAFTPNGDGKNDFFGPFWESGNPKSYIKNAIIVEFKLIIYDKYGGKVFATDNSADKWNGTAYGGSPVGEGGYIYYMWFKTSQGKTFEKSSTINVVYP